MKKYAAVMIAIVLTFGILTGCGDSDVNVSEEAGQSIAVSDADRESTEVLDWDEYSALIDEIMSTADFARREALMHEAEDMLMETGIILPVYHYNDTYMQKDYISGIYSNPLGVRFFMFSKTPEGTLRPDISGEPDELDPALCKDIQDATIAINSFAGLYSYDANGRVIPDLAADEQVSEDGLTYTVTLLPDLKWSDGTKLDADDFIYAWNRAANEETAAAYAYMFDVIDRNDDGTLRVEASDEGQIITIRLTSPCAYFNELLAFPVYFPVKQSEVEKTSDWETDPGEWAREAGFISNGAYTLTTWIHGESMTYTKNPYYHRADEVETTSLQYMLCKDDAAACRLYSAGYLDFMEAVPDDIIADMLDDQELHMEDIPGTCYVIFNWNGPLFAGKSAEQASAMRRALALLVDREYICNYVTGAGQKPANTYIPPCMSDGNGGIFKANDDAYTYPDEGNTGYFDPHWSADSVEKAIALLEYAGFKFENGMLSAENPISFEYLVDDDPVHIAVAEALRQDFTEIGIDMTINIAGQDEFIREKEAGNYDAAYGELVADLNDPICMLEN